MEFEIEEIEFDEELYKKNIAENDFSGSEIDGMGVDLDENN